MMLQERFARDESLRTSLLQALREKRDALTEQLRRLDSPHTRPILEAPCNAHYFLIVACQYAGFLHRGGRAVGGGSRFTGHVSAAHRSGACGTQWNTVARSQIVPGDDSIAGIVTKLKPMGIGPARQWVSPRCGSAAQENETQPSLPKIQTSAKATPAVAGRVMTHAQRMRSMTPSFRALKRLAQPTPMMLVVMA